MIVVKVLAGIEDAARIRPYLLSSTPVNKLVQHYNLIAANDCNMKSIHENTTGAELKELVAALDHTHQIELLHEYLVATKISECKYDPTTSCTADKVSSCTVDDVGSCTRVSKINIAHIQQQHQKHEHAEKERRVAPERRESDRGTPDRRKGRRASDKVQGDACEINNEATTYYAKSLYVFSLMGLGCIGVAALYMWGNNMFPSLDNMNPDVGTALLDIIKFIVLPQPSR